MTEKYDPSSPIDNFVAKYRFLSNFWVCDVTVDTWWGIYKFKSVEHAYQAQKAEKQADFEAIMAASTCFKAKRLGNFYVLRHDWDQIKDEVMLEAVSAKFLQNKELGILLLETGDREIIEGNTWNDTYWGVCRGRGKNKLGEILMQVRKELHDGIAS